MADKNDHGFKESLPAVSDDRGRFIAPIRVFETERDSSTLSSVDFQNECSEGRADSAVASDLTAPRVAGLHQDDTDSQPIMKRQRKARDNDFAAHAQDNPGSMIRSEIGYETKHDAGNRDLEDNSTRLPRSQSQASLNNAIMAQSLTPSIKARGKNSMDSSVEHLLSGRSKTLAHLQSLVQNDTPSSTGDNIATIAKVFFHQ